MAKYEICFRHDTESKDQWVTVSAQNRHEAREEARRQVDTDRWYHYGTRIPNPPPTQ